MDYGEFEALIRNLIILCFVFHFCFVLFLQVISV